MNEIIQRADEARRRESTHVMQGDHQRLSRFLDVKVERSYSELDNILEEEKKMQFSKTDTGKARSRLWGPTSSGAGQFSAVERANNLLHRPKILSQEEQAKNVKVINKRAVFSPRSPTSKSRIAAATHLLDRSPPSKNKISSHSNNTVNTSPPPMLVIDPPSSSNNNKNNRSTSPNNEHNNNNNNNNNSNNNITTTTTSTTNYTTNNKTKIKPAPLALRSELAVLGLELTDTMKEHATDPNETPELNEDEKENQNQNEIETEESMSSTTQHNENEEAIDDIDLSMMFVRPPLRGVGPDGAALRGDSIEVKRVKRLLHERGLNNAGNDILQLKLRMTHADLLDEIDSFQKHRGGNRHINLKNSNLSKNTQMMRKMAKMHRAEMWRNLGNDKVKRFVETFTLVHADPPTKKRSRFGVNAISDKELADEMQQKVKQTADYVRHQHMIQQTRYRACALCEHRYDIRNLQKTVTLKSVWNQRKKFPHPVEMPHNLEGRWDKLYGVVRVCALCAQFFEPDVLKGDEDQEAEREAEAVMMGLETRKRWRSWSTDATQLRESRTKSLLQRNKSVFTKPCGFGGSAIRPSLFGITISNDKDKNIDTDTDTDTDTKNHRMNPNHRMNTNATSPAVITTPVRKKTPGMSMSMVVVPSISPVRIPVVAPVSMVPNITIPRRPGTAGAASSDGQYLRRGDGARIDSKQNPRPKSAAPRSRVRQSAGFGTTSSRILPYRGHNNMTEKVDEYRATRIDPMIQARAMMMAQTKKGGLGSGNTAFKFIPRRPASAGPGTRRKSRRNISGSGSGGGPPSRPQSASIQRRRSRGSTFKNGSQNGKGFKRFKRRRRKKIKKKMLKKKRPEWVGV